MTLLDDLLDDLAAESDALREVVAPLDAAGWATPTPAPGWSVATQLGHLTWTDEVATLAALSPRGDDSKQAWDDVVLLAIADPTGFVDDGAIELGALEPADLLTRWDVARADLVQALAGVPEGEKLPWFGPPMSPTSMVSARFMETWAHAQDVHDALGTTAPVTDRIRHVAHLGVRTRGFSFTVHDEEPPGAQVRVELTSPGGDTWVWGPDDAPESVRGPALDFCRLVTQRVHRDDTALVAEGAGAQRWLEVAQCFAGPTGAGREVRGG